MSTLPSSEPVTFHLYFQSSILNYLVYPKQCHNFSGLHTLHHLFPKTELPALTEQGKDIRCLAV